MCDWMPCNLLTRRVVTRKLHNDIRALVFCALVPWVRARWIARSSTQTYKMTLLPWSTALSLTQMCEMMPCVLLNRRVVNNYAK
jgi:hypothetical protein